MIDLKYGPPSLGLHLLLPCLAVVESMGPCSDLIYNGYTRIPYERPKLQVHMVLILDRVHTLILRRPLRWLLLITHKDSFADRHDALNIT